MPKSERSEQSKTMPGTLSNCFNWYWWRIYRRWKYLGWGRRIVLHSHIHHSCHFVSCVFNFAENHRLLPSNRWLITCMLRCSQSPELPIVAESPFKYPQLSCFIESLAKAWRESEWYRQRRNEFRANIAPQFIIAWRWRNGWTSSGVEIVSRILIEIGWERMVWWNLAGD
jgi:hypothetical protein